MDVRIALCEDHTDYRESLVQYIHNRKGYTLVTALTNAQHILEEVARTRPNVILMDINLPGIDGIKATQQVKQAFPEVQVLMLTVYEEEERIFQAILAGATGYLLKKTVPQKILEAIDEVMLGGASMNSCIVKKVLSFFSNLSIQPRSNDYLLSEREKTILRCIVQGDSYKMIADHCAINIGTVRFHIRNIYQKLHINSKSEAVAKVIQERLLP